MATLRQFNDEDPAASGVDDPAEADERMPPADGADDQDGDPSHDSLDPNDPKQVVGWIDPRLPAKVRVFLRACRTAVMSGAGESAIRKAAQSSDHIKGLALFIAKTIDMVQTKLGPLSDQEHDQVAFFLAGWVVSTMQGWGMPGLDDAGARQDMIGRILHALDALTGQGQQDAPGAAPPPGGPDAGAEAPPAPGGAPAGEEEQPDGY